MWCDQHECPYDECERVHAAQERQDAVRRARESDLSELTKFVQELLGVVTSQEASIRSLLDRVEHLERGQRYLGE